MSEYQYLEFLAVDRPLDARQQAEVRALSTRARVTATSFVNEYHWGNFRGDPSHMMEHYYDAHLYLTNWGSRLIMLRIPRSLLDLDTAELYCVGEQVAAWTTGDHLILDLTSEDELATGGTMPQESLSAIIGLRPRSHRRRPAAALPGLAGRLRQLATRRVRLRPRRGRRARATGSTGTAEPHRCAARAGGLPAPRRCPADVAATASPSLDVAADDPHELAGWMANLTTSEKDHLLLRVVTDHPATVRLELLRRFRDQSTTAVPVAPRRTVAEILDATANQHAERERQAAAQRAEQKAARERAHAVARTRWLNDLARDEDAAWARVDAMIATKKPAEYDAAVTLLTDLRALADRDGHPDTFARRSTVLREKHTRKPSLIERLNSADIGIDPTPDKPQLASRAGATRQEGSAPELSLQRLCSPATR